MLKAAHSLVFKHINSLLTCLSYDVSSGRAVPLATAAERTQTRLSAAGGSSSCARRICRAWHPLVLPGAVDGTPWTGWQALSRLSTYEASVDPPSSSLGSGLKRHLCEVSWWLNPECSDKIHSNHFQVKIFFPPFSFLLSLSFLPLSFLSLSFSAKHF